MSEFYDPNIPIVPNFEAEGLPMGPPAPTPAPTSDPTSAPTSDPQGNPNRNAENFMRALGEYFQDYNVAKDVRETTTAFVLGLEGMERNLVEVGMRQVIDQLRAGSDDIDNPLRTGFLSELGFLSDYAPSLVEFFEGTFGDNDTISNIEFGSAFGIPAETITEYDNSVLNVQEAKDIYKEVTGQELTDEEAEQMIESAGEVAEADFGTYVEENVEKSLAESLGGLAQSVLDVLFGTKRGGGSKSIEEILKEQMDLILPPSPSSPNYEQEMTEWIKRQSGSIISINHAPNAANPVFAGVRFPVPIPVSGPEIIIPIFDQAGVYQGGTPVDMANLVIDRVGNVITETGTKIGEMKDNVLRVFDEAGNVVRAVALEGGTDPTTGLAVYTPAGWAEGDPNPFDIKDSDGDGVIDAQTDAAGNPVDDNGIPINKEPDENDEETPTTASPYDVEPGATDSEAAEGFYGSFPDELEEQKEAILSTLSEELDALGIAVEDVEGILEGIETTLEDVATTDDLDALRDNINEDLEESLGALGLDIEEVNDIVESVATDLDTLSGDVAAVGEAVEAVSGQLGQPAELDDEGNVVSESTGLYAEIDALVAEGASRAEAVDQVLSGLATDLGTTKTEILEQLGTTEANLSTEIQAVGEAVEAVSGQVEDLDKELNDRIDALVDQGATEYEALSGAISSLASDLDISEENILSAIATSDSDIKALIGTPAVEDDPNTDEDESAPATGIYAEFGETEANILDAVEGVSAQIDATNVNIGNLNELIVQYELDGKSRDEALSLALGDLSTDLGLTRDELLTSIGETEDTILTRIAESEDNTNEYLTYISNIIGVPTSEITQEDIDGIVGLLGEEEAITDINNDIRLYDANFDGVINDLDIGLLQGFVDAGVEGVGEIPATGLYADAAQRQLELQGYIDDSAEVTQGLISSEAADTRQLIGQTALVNALASAGDLSGTRVDVSTPDPARINYMYDFSDIFATPQQRGLFPSPYGGPQRAQQQQIAQKRSIMSGPLQIGGMARGGKVDYDFTDEIMQIMSYGDN